MCKFRQSSSEDPSCLRPFQLLVEAKVYAVHVPSPDDVEEFSSQAKKCGHLFTPRDVCIEQHLEGGPDRARRGGCEADRDVTNSGNPGHDPVGVVSPYEFSVLDLQSWRSALVHVFLLAHQLCNLRCLFFVACVGYVPDPLLDFRVKAFVHFAPDAWRILRNISGHDIPDSCLCLRTSGCIIRPRLLSRLA